MSDEKPATRTEYGIKHGDDIRTVHKATAEAFRGAPDVTVVRRQVTEWTEDK